MSPGAGVPQQLQAIQVHPNTSNSDSSPETSHTSTNSTGRVTMCSVKCSPLIKSYISKTAIVKLSISFRWITAIYWLISVLAPCPQCDASFLASASLPATIVTSSVPTSVAGHMMYPSPHTVMYASTPALADGGLAVLNAFSQATPTMQVSHAQAQDTGAFSENVHETFLCHYTHL